MAETAPFTREAWESRDVLKPLVKRRLSDRRRALSVGRRVVGVEQGVLNIDDEQG